MLKTMVVAVRASKTASHRAVDEMRQIAQNLSNIDVVEVCPKSESAISQCHEVFSLSVRSPVSTLNDRLIDRLAVHEQLAVLGSLIHKVVVKLRQRARPICQKLDRMLWPLPDPNELNSFVYEMSSLMVTYDRSYIVFVDAQSFVRTIKLSRLMPFDAAGSMELFMLVTSASSPDRSM